MLSPHRAIPAAHRATLGFDPACSAGLFVGVSTFEDPLFVEVPFAVDDAVDLAHLFTFELELLTAPHVVLALAGEPRKDESTARMHELVAAGAQQTGAEQTDIYSRLDQQRRKASARGLLIVTLATHGFSDQGGRFPGGSGLPRATDRAHGREGG